MNAVEGGRQRRSGVLAASEAQVGPAGESGWQRFEPDTSGGTPNGSLPVIVRSIRIADLPRLRSVPTVLRLNQPEINLTPYSLLRTSLAHLAPWSRSRPRVFVASVGGRLVGYAHFQPVLPDQRWQLIALGAATGVYDAAPVWEEMVKQATIAAGLRGVKRLYARMPVGSPAIPSIRAVGFAPYASETVFVGEHVATGSAGAALRTQEQTDTWAIHQLYNAAVPREVQYAEALTSHQWDVRLRQVGQPRATVAGWLLEENHQVLGYVRATSCAGTHVLELIYHPQHVQVVDDLIDGALGRVRAHGRVDRVYCAVRGYQAEAATALERRSFAPLGEQDLHVKYTTANVRAVAVELAPVHAEVIDRLPKRVPSFLHGKPQDESAT